MSIRQVNATYVQDEDRILLRIMVDAAEEFRFWLTRQLLCTLLPQANAWLTARDGDTPDAVVKHAFKRESAAATADFSVPLKPGHHFPLGEAPLLVRAVHLNGQGENASLHLELLSQGTITINLDETALAAVFRLLGEISHSAGWWAEQQAMAATQTAEPAAPKLLH